jgi:hypothetical protein
MTFSEVTAVPDLAIFLGVLILAVTILAVVRYLRHQ